MNEKLPQFRRLILGLYWLFFLYHLVRDILQLYHVDSIFNTIAARSNHQWCRGDINYCSYITFPVELFALIAIPMIWNRKKAGAIEILVYLTFPVLVLMWALP